MHNPTSFVTPPTDHWLEREIVQLVHHEGSIQHLITPQADTLPQSYIYNFYTINKSI